MLKYKFTWFHVLRISAFLIFLGRAYQFFFFGAPFRAFLWDESLMSPLVESVLGITWNEYAANLEFNYRIEIFTKFCSFLLLTCAFTALFWNKIKFYRLRKVLISIGILILVVLGICIFKSKNYSILQLFELFIQLSIPYILVSSRNVNNHNINRIKTTLKVALSLTFISHGLFAMGIPFYPGHFIDMTISITSLTEDQSKVFLTIAGILDICAAILIYFPKTTKIALIYILVWGLFTALARVFSGFNISYMFDSIHNSLYATIYRIPHGLVAAILFLITYSQIQKSKT